MSQTQITFLRLSNIIGNPAKGIPPIIPVSKSTWWAGVAEKRFPAPLKLSPGVTVWRSQDIDALCAKLNTGTTTTK
jgi:hypothetical protein